ncbi:hypothetical protein OPT61_g1068 [Boeremia exigua]|uniref:Uncharacterized protein n=1 Tax=Boeremia exigua TaxID=749465 RepID=A0ACC2IRT2_9PLEO|nr:hypothetical protein OPT61_g1068 [Boeremia exigua]
MRFSVLAFAGLAAAVPHLQPRQDDDYNLTGAYWDASITTQSGRPGYTIRDLTVSFHNPLSEQAVSGTCHYSFVPQGTSNPAITSTCDTGLSYTWNSPTLTLTHKVPFNNETLTLFGTVELTSSCRGDGSGGGSTCVAAGKVELSHYCRLGPPIIGCFPPDGNACGEFCEN